jgi:glutamate 5-kinase
MRVVVKIGTSSTTVDDWSIDREAIARLCEQVATVRAAGHEVLVVSSGAVAAGVGAVGLSSRPTDVTTLQALAAAGQGRLMEVYNAELGRHGLVGAQVLLVPHDFVDRRQYLHARRTISRVLELGCVPVVNENDTIASDELRFGDNDRLAALLAHNVGADVLVLLTDTDGLYTADPRTDPTARIIAHVTADDPLLAVSAGARGTTRGSGGMASKLAAARIASWSGVRTVIARAHRPDVLPEAVAGVHGVGTTFAAHDRWLPARKLWIAFAAQAQGVVVVDDGARQAITERNTSLLPAGVLAVQGDFDEGDTVEVRSADGLVFARGMVQVDAVALERMKGRRTSDLPAGAVHEVVHRDDLVLLPG